MKTISVYRAGRLRPVVQEFWHRQNLLVDYFIANERAQGHSTAIFASPTLETMKRWDGNWNTTKFRTGWKLEINPKHVWVYSAKNFLNYQLEEAELSLDKNNKPQLASTIKAVKKYWAEGIPLTYWESANKADYPDPEILVPRKAIVKATLVTIKGRILPRILQIQIGKRLLNRLYKNDLF